MLTWLKAKILCPKRYPSTLAFRQTISRSRDAAKITF